MDSKKLEELINQIENYLECWKQFNHFSTLARTKKYGQDDENQFLELKAVLAQQLEIILASVETSALNREEIYGMLGGVTSLRALSEQGEGVYRNLENQWHKIYIAWQAILGQLKVQQSQSPPPSFWNKLFGAKK